MDRLDKLYIANIIRKAKLDSALKELKKKRTSKPTKLH